MSRYQNPASARKAVRILTKVRNVLAEDPNRNCGYICVNISDVGGYSELATHLRKRVMSTLGGRGTFEEWARARRLPDDDASIQTMRLAYLDQWIAKLKRRYKL